MARPATHAQPQAMSDDRLVDEVRRIFDDVGALAERLQRGRFAESMQPQAAGEGPIVAATRRERARAVTRGIDGLAKVADGRERELEADERFGMQAIVLLEGRPAILIQGGDFLAPPQGWSRLVDRRERIREVIARCGRIEVNGHLNLDWLGTAFLVAPGTLMTNRHVAQEFCARDGASWRFRPGMTTRVDLLRELDSAAALEFEIIEALGIHERHDLALLRVDEASSDGRPLPEPLAVAATEPADLFERDVYVVGYPALDSRRNEPEPIRRIFADVYNVKRLQPGKAVSYSTEYSAVQHDCSTLGGNSGSPVVELESNQVIGLHFGGRYGVGNYAVPLWQLVEDPLLSQGGLNFQ
ncbi:MAG: endonuclease mitochondrial [Solirubrobacteraceae bacterium]